MFSIVSLIAVLTALITKANGESLVYENAGPIQAIEGQGDIGYYVIGDCMRFQFVVEFHSWCTGDNWCSVFHGGTDESFNAQLKQRMIGVWMHKSAESSDTFHIVFSHVASYNPTLNIGPSGDLALNTPYAFDISFTQTSLKVIINGEVIYNNVNYPNHCVAGDVCHGYAVGDPANGYKTPFQIGQGLYGNDYVGLPGTVSDIKIYSCDGPSCDGFGAGLRRPHRCSCEATCDGAFCHTQEWVVDKLGESGAGYCPSDNGLTCCCSCPDCPGYTDF